MTQQIKDPTRHLYGNSIVDLIFSNSAKIQTAGLLDWNISDHVPVIINIKKTKKSFVKDMFTGRSYRFLVRMFSLNR